MFGSSKTSRIKKLRRFLGRPNARTVVLLFVTAGLLLDGIVGWKPAAWLTAIPLVGLVYELTNGGWPPTQLLVF